MAKAELTEYADLQVWMQAVSELLARTILFTTHPTDEGDAFASPLFRLEPNQIVAYELLTATRHTAEDANVGEAASHTLIGVASVSLAGAVHLLTTLSGSTGSLHADTNMLALNAFAAETDVGVGVTYDDSGGTIIADNVLPGVWHIPISIDGDARGGTGPNGVNGAIDETIKTVDDVLYGMNNAFCMALDEVSGLIWATNISTSGVHIINPDTMLQKTFIALGTNRPYQIRYQPAFGYIDSLGLPSKVPARMWVGNDQAPGSISPQLSGWTINAASEAETAHDITNSLVWFPAKIVVDRRAFSASNVIRVGNEPLVLLGSRAGVSTWHPMNSVAVTGPPDFDFIARTGYVTDWITSEKYLWAIDLDGIVYRFGPAPDFFLQKSASLFSTQGRTRLAYDPLGEALYVTGNDGSGVNLHKINPNDLSIIWSRDLGNNALSVRYHEGYDVIWALESGSPAALHSINKDDGSTIFYVIYSAIAAVNGDMIAYPNAPYVFVLERTTGIARVYVGQ